MNTNRHRSRKKGRRSKLHLTKKGSYFVEAAITLPIFIIAILTMSSIILMYHCIEDSNFIAADEVRRVCAVSVLTNVRAPIPHRIKLRIEEGHSVAGEIRTKEYKYRKEIQGIDELIAVKMKLSMKSANPLGLAANAEYDLSCISRAYVGKDREKKPMSEAEFASDSTTVYIFPERGEKYHNKNCNVLKAKYESRVLSESLKRKYKPCPKCKSKRASVGAVVCVFPDDGEAYHMPNCKTLQRNYIEIEKSTAIERAYKPCLKCGG